MMETRTFLFTIEKIIGEFNLNHTTSKFLKRIVEDLESLPSSERRKYGDWILSITRTINNYGSKTLTVKQSIELCNQLTIYKDLIKDSPLYKNLYAENFLSSWTKSEPIFNSIRPMEMKCYDDEEIIDYSKFYVQKLDRDDAIYDLLHGLLDNLSRNVLDSSVTIFIEEYFEFVDIFTEEDPEKYKDIKNDVKSCLESHGWIHMKGFHSRPNREVILADLRPIIDKYF